MLTLLICIALFAGSVTLFATGLNWAARKVHSPRNKRRYGFIGVGLILVLNSAIGALGILSSATSLSPATAAFILVMLQMLGMLAVFSILYGVRLRTAMVIFNACAVVGLLEVVVTYAVIRPLIIEAFFMPTQSMSPTISPGDRFIVNKWLSPRRLDLVAYRNHTPPSVYCKRVIGLPGEHLRFQNGGLYVNEQQVALPPTLAGHCTAAPPSAPADRMRYHDGQTITLGPDEYFVIGDNADVSVDSRLEGPCPRSSLVGVIDLVYWPLGKVRIVR